MAATLAAQRSAGPATCATTTAVLLGVLAAALMVPVPADAGAGAGAGAGASAGCDDEQLVGAFLEGRAIPAINVTAPTPARCAQLAEARGAGGGRGSGPVCTARFGAVGSPVLVDWAGGAAAAVTVYRGCLCNASTAGCAQATAPQPTPAVPGAGANASAGNGTQQHAAGAGAGGDASGSSAPAAGSTCKAGTPTWESVIQHCGEPFVEVACECDQQQLVWMCMAAGTMPCDGGGGGDGSKVGTAVALSTAALVVLIFLLVIFVDVCQNKRARAAQDKSAQALADGVAGADARSPEDVRALNDAMFDTIGIGRPASVFCCCAAKQ